MATDRGARGEGRGARLAAVRAGPGGVRSLSRTVADLGGSPGVNRRARPGSDAYLPPGSRTSSATSSTTAPRRRRSTARCASSRERDAGHARAPRETVLSSFATASLRRRSESCAVARAFARLDRDRFRCARRSVSIETRPRLASTAFGQALLSLLRFAWSNGTRRELFSFLRTPYAGLGRSDVDFLEGRLRGRAVVRGDRTVEETTKLRTGPPAADARAARRRGRSDSPLPRGGARDGAKRLRPRRPAGQQQRQARFRAAELRARSSTSRAAARGRDRHPDRGRAHGVDRPRSAGRSRRPGASPCSTSAARTRRFEAVFVIGLEQGSLPRRDPTSPFFDDETRRD